LGGGGRGILRNRYLGIGIFSANEIARTDASGGSLSYFKDVEQVRLSGASTPTLSKLHNFSASDRIQTKEIWKQGKGGTAERHSRLFIYRELGLDGGGGGWSHRAGKIGLTSQTDFSSQSLGGPRIFVGKIENDAKQSFMVQVLEKPVRHLQCESITTLPAGWMRLHSTASVFAKKTRSKTVNLFGGSFGLMGGRRFEGW